MITIDIIVIIFIINGLLMFSTSLIPYTICTQDCAISYTK